MEDCISVFYETLGEQLYDTFDRLIATASAKAVDTATYVSPLGPGRLAYELTRNL